MKPYRIGIGVSKNIGDAILKVAVTIKIAVQGDSAVGFGHFPASRHRCHKESGGKTRMKKRIFASALAAVMVLSLCACGGNAASGAAASTGSAGSAAPEETKAAQEVTTAEAASTEEASTEASTAQYDAIEYPIEGDHSFTMTSVKRMNVAEALGEKDYSSTIESKQKMVPPILVSSIGGTAICANK